MSNGTNHMSNYNLICFEDLSATGDLDGKSWIGGNITSPLWFQMGDQYAPVPNDYVVVVCGTVGGTSGGAGINFSGGSNAKLVVKDSASADPADQLERRRIAIDATEDRSIHRGKQCRDAR